MKRALHQIRHHAVTPIRKFLNDSRAVGILLIVCTALSLLLSNFSATQDWYTSLWKYTTHFKGIAAPENSLAWINDFLMAFFFFLVGMEIKRELTVGELASVKKSLLPALAALGGMVVPALIFSLFNAQTPFKHGWGIPMATDIAFSLGVLSLLGKKVPVQLKIFLSALAIIDDLGAVVTIAIFYSSKLQLAYLLGSVATAAGVIAMNKAKVKKVTFYLIPGAILWYCLFNSGIHATIAGVVMAFAMPLHQLEKLEHLLFRPVNFIIMPLFALANTAIVLPSDFSNVFSSPISLGIIAGLFLGKPIGIFLFSFVATKLKIAAPPSNTTFKQLWGIGMMGGIGFTMSIFTSTLAYNQELLQVISKVSVMLGSLTAAMAGYFYLYKLKPAPQQIITIKTGEEPVYEYNEHTVTTPAGNIAVA
jgi:NhaA family Na+:H+ antiporter